MERNSDKGDCSVKNR